MSLTIKRKKAFQFLIHIFIFTIVYQSGSVQAATNPASVSFKVTRMTLLLIAIILCIYCIKKQRYCAKSRYLYLFLICETLALVNFFKYSESVVELQYKILLLLMFIFSEQVFASGSEEVDRAALNVIVVISSITLIMYVMVCMLHIDIPYSIYYAGENGTRYRNYCNIFYSYSTKRIQRICGLFWEPGVYQIYLNYGLLMYYKLREKNTFVFVLLLISIALTQSTAGYIIAAIIISAMLAESRILSKSGIKLCKILIGGMAFVLIAIVFLKKRESTNFAGDSYYDRLAQSAIGIKLFFQHPIFGTGFYNTAKFSSLDFTGGGNSNGLVTWLFTTGIAGLSIGLFPFIKNFFLAHCKREKKIVWLTFIYVLLINICEPIYSLPFMIWLLARQYSNAI